MANRKSITMHISGVRLRRLMRARQANSLSDLANTLLAEEEERLRSHEVIGETERAVKPSEIHDRLL